MTKCLRKSHDEGNFLSMKKRIFTHEALLLIPRKQQKPTSNADLHIFPSSFPKSSSFFTAQNKHFTLIFHRWKKNQQNKLMNKIDPVT